MKGHISRLLTCLDTLLRLDHKLPIETRFLVRSFSDRLNGCVDFYEELKFMPNDFLTEVVIQRAIEVIDSVINHPSLHDEKRKTKTPNNDLLFSKLMHILQKVIYDVETTMLFDDVVGFDEETTIHEEIVVGFDEETTILADRLTGVINKQLEMISIVGMPGLGEDCEVVFQEAIELVDSVINHPALHDDLRVPIWTKFLIGSEINHSKLFNEVRILRTSSTDHLLFCMSQLTHTLEDVIFAMEEAMPTKLYSLRSGVGVDEEIVVGFDEETTILADRLMGGINRQLEMISIVGMPGLGWPA